VSEAPAAAASDQAFTIYFMRSPTGLKPVWHWTSSPRRDLAHAADVLWAYGSELYEPLVLRRGMQLRQHGRFAAARAGRTPGPSEALAYQEPDYAYRHLR
jgi:hypothetical protein